MTPSLTVILSTWTTLDQMRNAVISGKLGAIMSIAAILAAMMAAAVLAIIPMIIIYIVFQKQFIEGIATSGGKL